MIVDAHHHLWDDPTLVGWVWDDGFDVLRRPFGMAELLPQLGRENVTGTVLVECGNHRHEDLDWLLATAEEHQQILGVVGWVDTTADVNSVVAQIERAFSHPLATWLKGLRVQAQSAAADHLSSESVRRAAIAMAERRRVLEIVSKPHHLLGAFDLAQRSPDCVIVLDHAGKPDVAQDSPDSFTSWRDGISALASAPNTYAKISGLTTQARWDDWSVEQLFPYANTLIELFGPRRLMIGSDWPACLPAGDYHVVTDAMHRCLSTLDGDDLGWVLGGTACAVYGLVT